MYIQGAGAFARIELNRLDTTEFIYAQLPKEIYRELGLQQGEKVFVRPPQYAGVRGRLPDLTTPVRFNGDSPISELVRDIQLDNCVSHQKRVFFFLQRILQHTDKARHSRFASPAPWACRPGLLTIR